MFGILFNNNTFDQFMTQIKDAKVVDWVLSEFEDTAEIYKPASSKTKFKIKNMSFWMKAESIKYIEHYSQQTSIKKSLKKVKLTKDSVSDIGGFDEDTLFSDFDNANVVVRDTKNI